MAIAEAMAAGLPVVCANRCGMPFMVRDGETGFVVEDEHAMAEAIGRLDEIDPERCRESARERFDVAAVAEAYEKAYEAVSSSPRSVTSSTDSVR
jgi:glycosyltransferase involved in cell wall biosynthesis